MYNMSIVDQQVSHTYDTSGLSSTDSATVMRITDNIMRQLTINDEVNTSALHHYWDHFVKPVADGSKAVLHPLMKVVKTLPGHVGNTVKGVQHNIVKSVHTLPGHVGDTVKGVKHIFKSAL
jgi:hypothetical protein